MGDLIPVKPLRHQASYENVDVRSGVVILPDDPDHQYDVLHHNHKPIAGPSTALVTNAPTANNRRRETPKEFRNPPSTSLVTNGSIHNNNRPRDTPNEAPNPANESVDCTASEGPRENRSESAEIYRVLVVFEFVFALIVFVLVLLFALGMLDSSNCRRSCNKEFVQPGQASRATQQFLLVMNEFRANMSNLDADIKSKDEIITQLRAHKVDFTRRIKELERNKTFELVVVNNSKIIGPQGPSGFAGAVGPKGKDGKDGIPGEKGPANMSLCRYETIEGAGQNVSVTEDPGSNIIGVACSTVGASEYNFITTVNDTANVREHACECKGQSNLFRAGANGTKCILNYWVCS